MHLTQSFAVAFPALRSTLHSAESAVATLTTEALPTNAYTELRDGSRLCRIITSIGKVAEYKTAAEVRAALEDMRALLAAGFTTFDVSDHFVSEQTQDRVSIGETIKISDTLSVGDTFLQAHPQ